MSPYWAMVSQFEPNADEVYCPFEFGDEVWTFVDGNTRFWQGSTAAPDQHFESFNEYQTKIRAVDAVCKPEVTFQFRPGLPDARQPGGRRIRNLPKDLPESIRVQVSSVNIDDEIIPLLQALADHIDVNPGYFAPYDSDVDADEQVIYPSSCNLCICKARRGSRKPHPQGANGVSRERVGWGSSQQYFDFSIPLFVWEYPTE